MSTRDSSLLETSRIINVAKNGLIPNPSNRCYTEIIVIRDNASDKKGQSNGNEGERIIIGFGKKRFLAREKVNTNKTDISIVLIAFELCRILSDP